MHRSIKYEDMDFVWISNHYDVHWEGLCRVDGKLCKFKTHDETNYEAMKNSCPYCGNDESDDIDTCTCEAYKTLMCEIIPLSVLGKIAALYKKKMFEICVGYHWSYPNRKQGVRFNVSKKDSILFKLYYFFKT